MKRKEIALILSCLMALGATACDDGTTVAGSYAEKTLQCGSDGMSVEQWIGGKWVVKETCTAPAKCKIVSAGVAGCTTAGNEVNIPTVEVCDYHGQSQCSPLLDAVLSCSDNGTELFRSNCKSEEMCDVTTLKCINVSSLLDDIKDEICENDSVQCHNNALVRCKDSHWTVSAKEICGADEECVSDEDGTGCYCNNGSYRCDDNELVKCVNFKWDYDDSLDCGDNFVCNATKGKCVAKPVCTPGMRECDSSNTYHVCDEDGLWGHTTGCEYVSSICSDGVCIDPETPGVDPGTIQGCTIGRTTCVSSTSFETCVEYDGDIGIWGESEECADGLTCKAGACIDLSVDPGSTPFDATCTNGDKVCVGNVSKLCRNGEWESKDCGEQTCKKGSCETITAEESGSECSKSERKCSGDGYIECVAGKWSNVISCGSAMKCRESDASCQADVISSECVDGTKRCFSKSYYQTCKNGVWSGQNACTSKNDSCINGECVKCAAGTLQCSGNTLQVCAEDGSGYVDKETCALGCSTGACKTCENGATQCSEAGAFQYCSNGFWLDAAQCGDACVSSEEAHGCGCTKDATKCDAEGNVLKCVEKSVGGVSYLSWEMQSSCGNAAACAENEGVAMCTCNDGDKRCADGSVQVCASGVWTVDNDCVANDMACVIDNEGPVCQCEEGLYRCPEDNSTQRQFCENHAWVDANCADGEVCSSTMGAACTKVQCEPLTTLKEIASFFGVTVENTAVKCDGANLLDCENGIYTLKKMCASSCSELPTGGGACLNNTTVDSMKDTLKCNFISHSASYCGASNSSVWKCSGAVVSYSFIETVCKTDEVCGAVDGGYDCVPRVCTSTQLACDGKKIVQCSNNTYTEIADCSTMGMICRDGACIINKEVN